MSSWLQRGLAMTAVHILVRVALAIAVVQAPLHSTVWKTVAVALVVLLALMWGGVDGIADARAHQDPDDYDDLTVRWLQAGLLAGPVAGIVSWLLGTFLLAGIGEANLVVELLAGGSFTALLIFIPAFFGAVLGRWLIRREQRRTEEDQQWSASLDAQTVD